MKILDEGHRYKVKNKKTGVQKITFFKDKKINGEGYDGTISQELIRVLIDRTIFLNEQRFHRFNDEIIFHLRKALALYEMRHLDRMIDKNLPIENLKAKPHIILNTEQIKRRLNEKD